jgi:hypothetical protein
VSVAAERDKVAEESLEDDTEEGIEVSMEGVEGGRGRQLFKRTPPHSYYGLTMVCFVLVTKAGTLPNRRALLIF